MSTITNSSDNGGPLPLAELKRWMSEDVHSWIKEGDEKQAQLDKAFEETAYQRLFGEYGSDSEDENDDEGDDTKSMSTKEKKYLRRIRHWSSSTTSPDGIGGFQPRESSTSSDSNSNDSNSDGGVQIVYMLSESAEGFGGILWSSARCIANTIADPLLCRELLSPIMDSSTPSQQEHPLQGISFLEIGAGAGVPSWAAMKCGARVVSTDLSDTDRIRCLAECAERNFQQILQSNAPNDKKETLLAYASKTRVCPHDWGSSVDGVLEALNSTSNSKEEQLMFDVIIAADCCYMPWWHKEMLESIYNLLSDGGVTIVAFALHGNTDDDDVWKIVDRAKDRGFCVEALDSQQLSPPYAAMESKQGLVHILRLTKPAQSA